MYIKMKTLNNRIYHASLMAGAALPSMSVNISPSCQELELNSPDRADLQGEQ